MQVRQVGVSPLSSVGRVFLGALHGQPVSLTQQERWGTHLRAGEWSTTHPAIVLVHPTSLARSCPLALSWSWYRPLGRQTCLIAASSVNRRLALVHWKIWSCPGGSQAETDSHGGVLNRSSRFGKPWVWRRCPGRVWTRARDIVHNMNNFGSLIVAVQLQFFYRPL